MFKGFLFVRFSWQGAITRVNGIRLSIPSSWPRSTSGVPVLRCRTRIDGRWGRTRSLMKLDQQRCLLDMGSGPRALGFRNWFVPIAFRYLTGLLPATEAIALMMPEYPVHRQRFEATRSCIDRTSASGFCRRNAVASIKNPGVQNPH